MADERDDITRADDALGVRLGFAVGGLGAALFPWWAVVAAGLLGAALAAVRLRRLGVPWR